MKRCTPWAGLLRNTPAAIRWLGGLKMAGRQRTTMIHQDSQPKRACLSKIGRFVFYLESSLHTFTMRSTRLCVSFANPYTNAIR
jgi:hypothetical protein